MIEWRVGRLLPGLLVLLATSPALAAGSNLCRQQEDALFSCTLTSGKQVSACAGVNEPSSSATSSPSTYRGLTYRFGSAEHIELSLSGTFPALRKQIFADEETAQNPIEDDFYLRFTNHTYSYLLFSSTGPSTSVMGLAIFSGNRLLKKTSCLPRNVEFNAAYNSLIALGVQPEQHHAGSLLFWSQVLPKASPVLARKRVASREK